MLDTFVTLVNTNPLGWVWVLSMFVAAGVIEGCIIFILDARNRGLL